MLQETAKKEYNITMASLHAKQDVPAESLSQDEEIQVLIELVEANKQIRGAPHFHEYVRHRIWTYLHETENEENRLAV
jgi:hypothetical protein